MSICNSDPIMARSYQMSSQRLKLNAVGHVLLAFLGVIGLLSLFSNHRMFLNMLEQLVIYDDIGLTHGRQNCSPGGNSASPNNRQGDNDIREPLDIREKPWRHTRSTVGDWATPLQFCEIQSCTAFGTNSPFFSQSCSGNWKSRPISDCSGSCEYRQPLGRRLDVN
jgi:hypothetical protein